MRPSVTSVAITKNEKRKGFKVIFRVISSETLKNEVVLLFVFRVLRFWCGAVDT